MSTEYKIEIPDNVIDAAYEIAVMEPDRQDVEVMLNAAFEVLGMKEEFDYSQLGPRPKKPQRRYVSDWRTI